MKSANDPIMQDSFVTKRGKGVRVYRPFDLRDGRRVPRDYYEYRVSRNRRRVKFRLPSNKREAGPRADEIAAFLADSRNTLDKALEIFCPDRFNSSCTEQKAIDPTIGQIIELFEDKSIQLQPRTIQEYVGALRRIAGFAHKPRPFMKPKHKDIGRWKEAVDSVRFSQITSEVLENYRSTTIKQAGSDLQRVESAKISANACIRNAAGLFGRRMLKYYKGFDLPEPLPFREVEMLKERHPRYHSTFDVREVLENAKTELKKPHPEAYLVILLAAYAGLRRSEITALRWDQVDLQNWCIWIHTTNEFRPKAANSEGKVSIPENLVLVLKEYKTARTGEKYVLPGSNKSKGPRCRQLCKSVYAWLNQQGNRDRKPLHALRKEAGSYIFQKTGSIDKASQFLRNDRRTAERHYVGQTERLVASYD